MRNQSADNGVEQINVGLCGAVKDKKGVVGLPEIEGGAQEQGEEVVVLVEAEAEETSVGMLELLEGGEAFNKAVLGLQSLGDCKAGSAAQGGHHLCFQNV